MVISSIVAPVAAELTVNRKTAAANVIEVFDPTVSVVTTLKELTIQRVVDGVKPKALNAGDCLVIRFSPVDDYGPGIYGPDDSQIGPFVEELTTCKVNVQATCLRVDAYEFQVTLNAPTLEGTSGDTYEQYALVLQEVGPF